MTAAPGSSLDAVPGDRHGVRESIIARMERHGGSAEVRSVPGEGTEVRLVMPDGDPVHRSGPDDDAVPAAADAGDQEATR